MTEHDPNQGRECDASQCYHSNSRFLVSPLSPPRSSKHLTRSHVCCQYSDADGGPSASKVPSAAKEAMVDQLLLGFMAGLRDTEFSSRNVFIAVLKNSRDPTISAMTASSASVTIKSLIGCATAFYHFADEAITKYHDIHHHFNVNKESIVERIKATWDRQKVERTDLTPKQILALERLLPADEFSAVLTMINYALRDYAELRKRYRELASRFSALPVHLLLEIMFQAMDEANRLGISFEAFTARQEYSEILYRVKAQGQSNIVLHARTFPNFDAVEFEQSMLLSGRLAQIQSGITPDTQPKTTAPQKGTTSTQSKPPRKPKSAASKADKPANKKKRETYFLNLSNRMKQQWKAAFDLGRGYCFNYCTRGCHADCSHRHTCVCGSKDHSVAQCDKVYQ